MSRALDLPSFHRTCDRRSSSRTTRNFMTVASQGHPDVVPGLSELIKTLSTYKYQSERWFGQWDVTEICWVTGGTIGITIRQCFQSAFAFGSLFVLVTKMTRTDKIEPLWAQ
ncbi:hypothetical protein SERLA73DRAFT_178945 [Serpula lacrymans var. lacrymans S7.3]|uniref:Uncharacterized protein n=1 Tax=Serpula lacrymans var. lacrymans (strain S7.3) TaxID=936435 RepID=F8PTA6_SERL3|nr:hypothetical protein SERLA73DRAFT_178945 [Serpula lacrymans var. lacrymans S7.3]